MLRAQAERIAELLPEILDDTYQTELPTDQDSESDPDLPRWLFDLSLPAIFSKVALAVGAVVILILIVNIIQGQRLRHQAAAAMEAAAVEPEAYANLQLPDADMLAAKGQYSEAIHALLLRSLVLLARRLGRGWPLSSTSREIIATVDMGQTPRQALQQMVTQVEVHHFGGVESDEEDWQTCLSAYRQLDESTAGGGS